MSDLSSFRTSGNSVCAILLQRKYSEWRKEMEKKQEEQPTCVGFLWDCALKEARESFAAYIGFPNGISFDVMLHLEMRYEEEKTGD